MDKELKDKIKMVYEDQEMKPLEGKDFNTIWGLFRSSAGAPTGKPVKFADQIVIDTTNARLYVYDTATGTWKYTALT